MASTACIYGFRLTSLLAFCSLLPAHLAHVELLRLPPLTLFAPEDNQYIGSAIFALVYTLYARTHRVLGETSSRAKRYR